MSDFYLPSLDYITINGKNKESKNNIKNNSMSNYHSFRTYLLGKNKINNCKKKTWKKINLNKSVNSNKTLTIKESDDIDKTKLKNDFLQFLKNKTYTYHNKNNYKSPYKQYKESNININNKTYTNNLILIKNIKKFFNYKTNNITNLDNVLKNNDNNINNISNNKNNKKYLKTFSNIESYRTYRTLNNNGNNNIIKKIENEENIKIQENIEKTENKYSYEINKIVNTLINSTNYESKKSTQRSIKIYPKEKTVDPISHIKFNLKYNPLDKSLYKGIDDAMKKLVKSGLKDEFEQNLIEKASDILNRKIDSDHIEAPLGEAQIYQKKIDDMRTQTKRYKSFHFFKNKTPQNKIKTKNYNPEMNILNKTYKIYFNKKFKIKRKEKEKNDVKVDTELEKNIDKYLSFDRRINNILFISKNTEESINQKKKEHKEMISKFNYMMNSINSFLK